MSWFAPVDVLRDYDAPLRFSEVLFARERRGSEKRFTPVAKLPGWGDYSGTAMVPQTPAAYALDSTGVVHLRGTLSVSPNPALPATMFYLPAQARPAYREIHICAVNDWYARVDVLPTGEVMLVGPLPMDNSTSPPTPQAVDYVLLDVRRFRAAAFA